MQTPISPPNNAGFTLVEVLVAMVIMLVGLVGLLQSVNMGMEHNMRNYLRDEAVRTGEQRMYDAKGLAFGSLTTSGLKNETRRFRGAAKNFTVQRTVSDLSANSKQVALTITWTFKGSTHTHQVTSIVGR